MSGFSKPAQLPKGVGITDFTCGDDVVDAWVRDHSATARKRGTAVIYASMSADGRIAGFYTLSTHSIARNDVSGGWLKRNAPGHIPVVLLGMLGVNEQYKGIGLGASLLKDAYENALKIADLAGARALVVDPSSESAEQFYEHFGFSRFTGTNRMALKL